jgi:hypothetical protein
MTLHDVPGSSTQCRGRWHLFGTYFGGVMSRTAARRRPAEAECVYTNKELLEAVRCKDYLISSNGKRFSHPSTEAIARIISFSGGTLHFNYRTEFNEMWDDKLLKKKHKYTTQYPAKEGIALTLD